MGVYHLSSRSAPRRRQAFPRESHPSARRAAIRQRLLRLPFAARSFGACELSTSLGAYEPDVRLSSLPRIRVLHGETVLRKLRGVGGYQAGKLLAHGVNHE